MIKNKIVTITGIFTHGNFGGMKSLLCSIPVMELMNIFSVPQDVSTGEGLFPDIQRPFNLGGIKECENFIISTITKSTPSPYPHVVLVIEGQISTARKLSSNIKSISFNNKDAYLVNGIQFITAICEILRLNNPFLKKGFLKQTKSFDESIKNKVAALDITVSILFKQESYVKQKDIINLLKIYNTHDYRIHSLSLGIHQEDNVLLKFVADVARDINLEHFGGMAPGNSKSKSSGYITTQTTMLGLVLAALGGRSSRLSQSIPTKLPDKTPITQELLDLNKIAIIHFMKAWLSSVENQFKINTNGFHYSTQVWQSLGLVIHHLLHDNEPSDTVFSEVGQKLGLLDYDKSAIHWEKCNALKLNTSKTCFINATGGGRSLRDGIAEYFISLI